MDIHVAACVHVYNLLYYGKHILCTCRYIIVCTVDRKIFTVKVFWPIVQVAKIKYAVQITITKQEAEIKRMKTNTLK